MIATSYPMKQAIIHRNIGERKQILIRCRETKNIHCLTSELNQSDLDKDFDDEKCDMSVCHHFNYFVAF